MKYIEVPLSLQELADTMEAVDIRYKALLALQKEDGIAKTDHIMGILREKEKRFLLLSIKIRSALQGTK